MRYLRLELQRISPELGRIRQEREAQERQQQARLREQHPDVPRTPPQRQAATGPPTVVRRGHGLRRTDSAQDQAVAPPNNNSARSGRQTGLFSRPRMKF